MDFGTAPQRPSAMKHQFSMVPNVSIERSKFDRSFTHKTTFNAGDLVPCFVDEVLPGDTFNYRLNAFARMATPIFPVMDNLFFETFYFFVPCRLVWVHWEKFNGAQDNPGDSTSFVVPQVALPATPGALVGSLADAFGLPTGLANTKLVNALPFRCANLIYNTWFRDENLQNSVVVQTDDGPDTYSNYVIKKRGKRHDYFTSCLPWPQKGTAVSLPLGGQATVKYDTTVHSAWVWRKGADGSQYNPGGFTAGGRGDFALDDITTPYSGLTLDPQGTLYADLSTATSSTINALRQAEQLQVFYERDARGGTRYIEILKSHFGVTSPDARLQRPEYLGGGSSQINFHPVPQTSPTSGSNPQGGLAAFGTFSAKGHGFNKSFVEHGYVIGFMNVRADLTYQQGLDKMWSRSTRADFYWPAFAHLGEQAVLNQEIYCQGDSVAADAETFGYQERYAEYRYKRSLITGQFRSTYSTPLDAWHLAQKFTSLPALNDSFISENPPMSRVEAVSGVDFLYDSYHDYICARPMPLYGVPTLGNRL